MIYLQRWNVDAAIKLPAHTAAVQPDAAWQVTRTAPEAARGLQVGPIPVPRASAR